MDNARDTDKVIFYGKNYQTNGSSLHPQVILIFIKQPERDQTTRMFFNIKE